MRYATHIGAFVAAILLSFSPVASAATLIVDGGILKGAIGVNVSGNLYDVQFVDGTCQQLFNGCNEISDFPFKTKSEAISAGQALLDQVFLDGPWGNFDSIPQLTKGCVNGFGSCHIIIPHTIFLDGTPPTFSAVWFENYVKNNGDKVYYTVGPGTEDTKNFTAKVYAQFNPSLPPVPEPETWVMMMLGFSLIAGAMRRQRSRGIPLIFS